MPEVQRPAGHAIRQGGRRGGGATERSASAEMSVDALVRWAVVVPVAAMGVLGGVTVVLLRGARLSPAAERVVLVAAVVAGLGVMAGAVAGAQAVIGRVHRRAAALIPVSASDPRVEVNLAWRMLSLIRRGIHLLDGLEAQVEDPDLLLGLFRLDHLVTRMRRYADSLAVIGGATSRRRWGRPVSVRELLRAAMSEVEGYTRVKIVPPCEGVVDGSAVADIVHMLAELIDNATCFSRPPDPVLLRVAHVTAGVAIEIDDRGLGLGEADRRRLNGLLADPGRVDRDEMLRDGRIGVCVVAVLAARHGVAVELMTNIYGGTRASVVIPRALVGPTVKPATAPSAAPGSVPAAATAPMPVLDGGTVPPVETAEGTADDHPPLPRRQARQHPAPASRDRPASPDDGPAGRHTPGLPAAFRDGRSASEHRTGRASGAAAVTDPEEVPPT